jgi:hypothetical protein
VNKKVLNQEEHKDNDSNGNTVKNNNNKNNSNKNNKEKKTTSINGKIKKKTPIKIDEQKNKKSDGIHKNSHKYR